MFAKKYAIIETNSKSEEILVGYCANNADFLKNIKKRNKGIKFVKNVSGGKGWSILNRKRFFH